MKPTTRQTLVEALQALATILAFVVFGLIAKGLT